MPITSNRNTTPWQLRPLTPQEAFGSGGYNYCATITSNDLTSVTTSGAQTFTLATWKSGDTVDGVAFRVKTAFSSTEASSTLALIIGQTGTTNLWVTSTEIDEEATEVFTGASDETVTKVYTAASDLLVTLTPASGKILNAYTSGQIEIYVKLFRTTLLEKATAPISSTK